MIEPDTIRLLRECDAGIKMGTDSIDDVMPHVKNRRLKNLLNACKDEHKNLDKELQQMLDGYGDEGKEPGFMAETMSKIKTGMKLQMDDTDNAVASLMTDGCNMGVKSLHRYLNQYEAADEGSKDTAKKLAHMEEKLTELPLSDANSFEYMAKPFSVNTCKLYFA